MKVNAVVMLEIK